LFVGTNCSADGVKLGTKLVKFAWLGGAKGMADGVNGEELGSVSMVKVV